MARMPRTFRLLTIAGLAGGLASAAAVIPAQAASTADSYGVTISARSDLPSVTGDTYVVYRGAKGTDAATLTGQVTGATSGDVVKLYARPFRTRSYKPTGKSKKLNGTSPQSYSFKVKPGIETRYQVRVLTGSTLDAAASTPVYVTEDLTFAGAKLKCHGATCRLSLRLTLILPASALRTESRKHWYLYVGALTAKGGLPKYFVLSRRSKAAKAVKVNRHVYLVPVTFIGPSLHHKLGYIPDACTKDTESRDGMGLPGHHGCGKHRVKVSGLTYLG
jgi:hypothetical protein